MPQACNFIKKEPLAQIFSYKFCEISRKTFSYRTPLVAASDLRTNTFIFHFKLQELSYKNSQVILNKHYLEQCALRPSMYIELVSIL